LEFDHADIYRDLPHYRSSFAEFVRLLPDDGLLAVSAAYPDALELARSSRARVLSYVAKDGLRADYGARDFHFSPEGVRFTVLEQGNPLGQVQTTMGGLHNVENALGTLAAARALGLGFDDIRRGLESFRGVKRRQEVRAEIGGILVVDDFAHHPTAVRETIAAVHQQYPERRLWAVFEPRSNTSRRNIHQEEYAGAFEGASLVSIKVPEPHDKVPQSEQLDVMRLVEALESNGIEATAERDVATLVERLSSGSRPGDIVLVMSNGSFGGLIDHLIRQLRSRRGQAP